MQQKNWANTNCELQLNDSQELTQKKYVHVNRSYRALVDALVDNIILNLAHNATREDNK